MTEHDERAAMDAAFTPWLDERFPPMSYLPRTVREALSFGWQARAAYDAAQIRALREAASAVVDGYDRALGKRELMERMNALALALADQAPASQESTR